MSISQRQFSILTEMGISLWQRRKLTNSSNTSNTSNTSNSLTDTVSVSGSSISTKSSAINNHKEENALSFNFSEISKQQIFQDILLSIGLSLTDVNEQNNYLDLGLLNWQFVNDETIILNENTLLSPAIENISNSSQLKRQLWLALQDSKQ